MLEISASAARVSYTPASEKVRLGNVYADAGVLGFGGPLVGFEPPPRVAMLRITLTPAEQSIAPGQTATFRVTIVNTGNEPLRDVFVGVADVPDCNKGPWHPGTKVKQHLQLQPREHDESPRYPGGGPRQAIDVDRNSARPPHARGVH